MSHRMVFAPTWMASTSNQNAKCRLIYAGNDRGFRMDCSWRSRRALARTLSDISISWYAESNEQARRLSFVGSVAKSADLISYRVVSLYATSVPGILNTGNDFDAATPPYLIWISSSKERPRGGCSDCLELNGKTCIAALHFLEPIPRMLISFRWPLSAHRTLVYSKIVWALGWIPEGRRRSGWTRVQCLGESPSTAFLNPRISITRAAPITNTMEADGSVRSCVGVIPRASVHANRKPSFFSFYSGRRQKSSYQNIRCHVRSTLLLSLCYLLLSLKQLGSSFCKLSVSFSWPRFSSTVKTLDILRSFSMLSIVLPGSSLHTWYVFMLVIQFKKVDIFSML